MSNISVPATGAPAWWGGLPPNYPVGGITGKGVIIGIISTGLDLAHADFRTAVNLTRVKYVWDQQSVGPGTGTGFNYGFQYTEAQINAGQVVPDANGRGTHMAGIAAGNGRATGNGVPQYRYVGMAPEADLVIVRSDLIEFQIIDAVTYIFAKANALGKSSVVLINAIGNSGAHDGTNSLDAALSALTGPGKIIVAAAGDQGGPDSPALHAQVNLASTGATAAINFSIPAYTDAPGISEFLDVEAWHEPSAVFSVRLTSPNAFTTGWISAGTSSSTQSTTDGSFLVQNGVTTNSKGAKQIRAYIYDNNDGKLPRVGVWTLEVQRQAAATTGLLDAWISSWRFGSNNVSPVFTSNISPTQHVMTPATGDSIIGAGAYTTRTRWTYLGGGTTLYSPENQIGAASVTSSRGPRRDGAYRPDVMAPGEGIASSRSVDATSGILNTQIVPDGVHYVVRGTAQAAAHVAGACALLLQQYPTIEPSDMRLLLAHHSVSDSFTGTVPNATWGNGKLSLRPRCS